MTRGGDFLTNNWGFLLKKCATRSTVQSLMFSHLNIPNKKETSLFYTNIKCETHNSEKQPMVKAPQIRNTTQQHVSYFFNTVMTVLDENRHVHV